MRIQVCVCVCKRAYACVYRCMHALVCMRECVCVRTRTHTHSCMQTNACVSVCVCAHAYTHTHVTDDCDARKCVLILHDAVDMLFYQSWLALLL